MFVWLSSSLGKVSDSKNWRSGSAAADYGLWTTITA